MLRFQCFLRPSRMIQARSQKSSQQCIDHSFVHFCIILSSKAAKFAVAIELWILSVFFCAALVPRILFPGDFACRSNCAQLFEHSPTKFADWWWVLTLRGSLLKKKWVSFLNGFDFESLSCRFTLLSDRNLLFLGVFHTYEWVLVSAPLASLVSFLFHLYFFFFIGFW